MKKFYDKVSFKSKYLQFLFKFTNAKKNYLNEENVKKFINKYHSSLSNYDVYEKMDLKKEIIGDNEVYLYNGDFDSRGNYLIYVHGGSFVEEAISYQINFACKIAKLTNSTLVIPRYTLIPDGNYNKLYSLMDKIYKIVIDRCKDYNLLGDSSGGFVLAYSMYLRDNNKVLPKNVLLLSPWVDLSMENPELIESMKLDAMSGLYGNKYCGKLWADDLDVKNPKISSMYGTFNNLSKITIATGSYDILKPDCVRLSQKLEEQGIDYNYIEFKNQGHDFGCYPTVEGKKLIEYFASIINNGGLE